MKVLLGLAVIVATIGAAQSSTSFPTVAELENALHLARDRQLPKDVQAASGVIFHSYYEGARELSDGRYAIIVRLAP